MSPDRGRPTAKEAFDAIVAKKTRDGLRRIGRWDEWDPPRTLNTTRCYAPCTGRPIASLPKRSSVRSRIRPHCGPRRFNSRL